LDLGFIFKEAGISSSAPFAPSELFNELCGCIQKMVAEWGTGDAGESLRETSCIYEFLGILMSNKKVGVYDDFDVIMSNNMAKDEDYAYCDIRGKKAIAFAGQINEVEALRSEKRFKDIIRGLDTFGAKVIYKARIQVIKVPVA
jgi:hypothetical protein